MLSSLTRLKQICNHPAQYLQDNSEFTEKRSLKLQRLISIVDEAIENEESILIFSQYKEICMSINKMLAMRYNAYLLHGGTSRTARDNMINEFQDSNTPPSIFILSLKAGGVGITLTKASQVIHFDRWWNPAVENQATDRAFRIGQPKKVLVHKFITQGTLEEKIDQMITDKSLLSESILSDDSSWLKDLNSNTFMELVKLREEALSNE
jgi:SNF2 family DNA or RNA helicase